MTTMRTANGILAVCLFAAAASVSHAQPRGNVDTKWLRTGTDTLKVSYAGNLIGHGITSRSRSGPTDKSQVVQVYRWHDAQGAWTVDSLFSDARSLATIREVRVDADTLINVSYTPTAIEISVRDRKGGPAHKEVTAASGVFSSATLDAMVSSSPLSSTFDHEYRFFYAPPSKLGIVPIRVKVTGAERINDRSGRERDAWVVAAGTPSGGTVFWVDKETRAILKYDTREGPAVIEFRR